jgi:hypothetical protein
MRVAPDVEIQGLDYPEMGLGGYIPDDVPLSVLAARAAAAGAALGGA